jgi:phosphatidate cytidylyltransferase
MLRLRIATAVVLLVVLVTALTLGPLALATVLALLIGAAAFEWLRLAGHRHVVCVMGAITMAVALLALEILGVRPRAAALAMIGAGATAVWLALIFVLLQAERHGVRIGRAITTVLGVVILAAAWVAALDLYRHGITILLSTLAIVWVADIAAYFIGRAFGRARLAPRVSPGKTWAGALGALGAVLIVALVVWQLWPATNLFSNRLFSRGAVAAVLLLALLVILAIVGDLFESLLKRLAQVKDSSQLLPGHGGVLDRIDALLPTLPAAMLLLEFGH